VIELAVPPLAQRRDDVLPLAESFLDGRARLAASAVGALQAHAWPGNVRELKNTMQRAGLLSEGARIGVADLGLPAASAGTPTVAGSDAEPDRDAIEAALRKAGGVVAQAAVELGLSRQALYRRMERLGIERPA
jgi:DNA-binding NtrC family response regulator